ncbi:MAG: patatin-like phospholipase family protein [Thermodesulfobacteriota bacterium]
MASPRIGLALGSGSARGWAHIGVLQALEEMGVKPDVISGCSAGAIVAGAYAGGNLQKLADWLVTLNRKTVLGFFDFSLFGGGVIAGERLFDFFKEHIGDSNIEDLPIPFTAVATELDSGREVWLNSGSLLEAIRASISLPGMFTPARINNEWMIDGGLVNPIPVSACWAMKAEVVIAVNVSAGIIRAHLQGNRDRNDKRGDKEEAEKAGPDKKTGWWDTGFFKKISGDSDTPGVFDVIHSSILIMQERITRSRLAGDPPDLLLLPRVSDIGLMEFHRAQEAIDEGRRCVERAGKSILDVIELNQ